MSIRAPGDGRATQTGPAARVALPTLPHHMTSDIVVGPRTQNRVDRALSKFAEGRLSPARHTLIDCLVSLNPDIARRLAPREDKAAARLRFARAVPLSPYLIGDTLEVLPKLPSVEPANDRAYIEDADAPHTPSQLEKLVGGCVQDLNWSASLPGVAVHDIIGDRTTTSQDRLYLLKIKAGLALPTHSHEGEEWSLILSGAYRTGKTIYRRGDLHVANAKTTHAPEILDGEDCVCLVMASGKVRMQGLLPKLAQAIVGI